MSCTARYPDSPDDVRQEQEPEDESPGFFGRLRKRFRFARLRERFAEMLAEAERERHQPHTVKPETGWAGRFKRRTLRWVAESIAEQRLLWLLRKETEARLYYPDDLDGHAAMGIVRSQLGRDFDKHRFWMIVDTTRLYRIRPAGARPRPQPARVLLRVSNGRSLLFDERRASGAAIHHVAHTALRTADRAAARDYARTGAARSQRQRHRRRSFASRTWRPSSSARAIPTP